MIKRINRLRACFYRLGIDAVYLTSAVSHRYFTGIDNPDGALLITHDSAYALEDFRYIEVAGRSLGKIYKVTIMEKDLASQLSAILKNEKIKRLGFENNSMSVARYEKYKSELKARLIGIGNTVAELRAIKDETEIASIVKAQMIAEIAYDHILKMLSPTMTENDVAAELEYIMRKNGAEDKSFDTIAVSGAKSSMPHGVPSDTKLQRGFLTMDFGATVDGYHSDMTRTVCIGYADSEMKRLYSTVLMAQREALCRISCGMLCSDADKIARDIIDKDYKGCFGHSLGHGVGLEIHESPNLSPSSNKILTRGNIVTVEPGIYIAGKYGCRIEDMVLIEDNYVRNLTKSPKELIEII